MREEGGSDDLDGQGVQPARKKILQRIIHKAMLGDSALAGERGGGDAHPKVGARAGAVGAHMARVVGAYAAKDAA